MLLRGVMNDSILQLFLKRKHFQISDAVFGPRRKVRISKDSLSFQVQIVQRGTLCPSCWAGPFQKRVDLMLTQKVSDVALIYYTTLVKSQNLFVSFGSCCF